MKRVLVAVAGLLMAGCVTVDPAVEETGSGFESLDRTFTHSAEVAFLAPLPGHPGAEPCDSRPELASGEPPRGDFKVLADEVGARLHLEVAGGEGVWRFCAEAGQGFQMAEGTPPLRLELIFEQATSIRAAAVPISPPAARSVTVTIHGVRLTADALPPS